MTDMRSGVQSGLNLTDSVYERLLRERIIFLGTQVDDDIANRLCAQILLLAAEDPTKDITLYINSPGGSVTAGMAIYDTMVFAPCDVATYAMGLAASMGQFLLAAGSQGQALRPAARADHDAPAVRGHRRYRRRHRHPGRAVRTDQEGDDRLNAEFTGQTIERIETDADRDRWFTAQEALEYGFVDHIITRAHLNGSAS